MVLYMESLRVFIGDWIWWVVGFELRTNWGSELGLWDGRVLGTILGSVDGLSICTFDGSMLEYLEGFVDGAVVGKFLCLCTHVRLVIFEMIMFVYVYVV